MSHQLLALRLRLIDSSPDVAKFIEERHALRTKSWEPGGLHDGGFGPRSHRLARLDVLRPGDGLIE